MEPTERRDSFARGTVEDRLAVLAFMVAAVEPRRARTHGVLLRAAFLQCPLVAVWETHREAFRGIKSPEEGGHRPEPGFTNERQHLIRKQDE